MVDLANISKGDELPSFTREGTVHHWNRFAAVNDEFAAHHWDEDVAKEEGFPAPFAMAPLQHAFWYALVREWLGDACRILEINLRLRSPFLKGRTLTASGTVTGIDCDGSDTRVDLELLEKDDEGTVVATGSVRVLAS